MARNRNPEMSADEKALLATIWESPLDDVPRLVYADWLQETNTPKNIARAEFIRLQWERSKLDAWTPRAKELLKQEEELLKIFDPEKFSPKFENEPEVPYIRGFLESRLTNRFFDYDLENTVPYRDVFSLIRDHYWEAPTWDVTLCFDQEVGDLFDFRTLFSRIRCLTLETFNYEEEEDVLWPIERHSELMNAIEALRFLDWTSLTDLSLSIPLGVPISDQLIDSSTLDQIRVLRLWTQALPDTDGLRILLESGKLKELKKLIVSGIGNDGALFRSLRGCSLPSLTSLEISGGIFGDRSVNQLCQWDLLDQLQELRLPKYHSLTPSGFQLLAQCPRLNWLKALQISARSSAFPGIRELSQSPFLQNLEYLEFYCFGYGRDPAIESILQRQFGDRLKITDESEDEVPF